MEHLIVPARFEVKAAAGANVATVTGIANATNFLDATGDVTLAGFASRDLRERGAKRPLLAFHDMKMPIGEVELAETARGLEVVKGTIVLDPPMGKGAEIYALLKQAPAALGGYSIGYIVERERFTKSGVREIVEASIWEISIVVVPANSASRIDAVKHDPVAAIRRIAAEMRATLGGAPPTDDLRAVRDAFRRLKLTI